MFKKILKYCNRTQRTTWQLKLLNANHVASKCTLCRHLPLGHSCEDSSQHNTGDKRGSLCCSFYISSLVIPAIHGSCSCGSDSVPGLRFWVVVLVTTSQNAPSWVLWHHKMHTRQKCMVITTNHLHFHVARLDGTQLHNHKCSELLTSIPFQILKSAKSIVSSYNELHYTTASNSWQVTLISLCFLQCSARVCNHRLHSPLDLGEEGTGCPTDTTSQVGCTKIGAVIRYFFKVWNALLQSSVNENSLQFSVNSKWTEDDRR